MHTHVNKDESFPVKELVTVRLQNQWDPTPAPGVFKPPSPTGGLSGEQSVQLGVALHVVVLGQTAPEGPEGGPALSQDPGHQGVHGPVDRLLPLAQHSVLGDADSRELTSLLLLHDNAFNS